MTRKAFSLFIVFMIIILCAACQSSNEIPFLSKNIDNYEIESGVMDFKNENFVLKYPYLSSHSNNVEKANTTIKSFLDGIVQSSFVDVQDTAADIDFKITYLDSEYISIRFEGYSNYIYAAHPTDFYFTINMRIEDGYLMELNDIVTIDEIFIQKFRACWMLQVPTKALDYLEQYTDEHLKQMLINSGDSSYGVYSCFSNQEIFIFFPVAHPIGDYIVITINNTGGCSLS